MRRLRVVPVAALLGIVSNLGALGATEPDVQVSTGDLNSSVIISGHQDGEQQSHHSGGGTSHGGGSGTTTTLPPYGCNLPIQGVTGADAQMALVEGCPTGDPAATGPAGPAPTVNPAAVAIDVIRRHPLPVPRPTVTPEPMLVVLPTYLDLHTPATYTHTEPTPLGPVVLTARAQVTVDWGDGATTGPTADTGGPYPEGTLTHRYAAKGDLTLTVTVAWTVDWSYLGASGTVGDLRTSAATTVTLIDAQATTS